MNVNVIVVGKVKEKFYRDAIDEYLKRLSKYATVKVFEVADEKTKEFSSDIENEQIKAKEGERLLKHINDKDYVCALAIEGKQMDSVGFSNYISTNMLNGKSTIDFVIGGSLGLSKDVYNRADYLLSFSKMTFPHQLMRVVLLEQIYRAFRIMNNEPYHK